MIAAYLPSLFSEFWVELTFILCSLIGYFIFAKSPIATKHAEKHRRSWFGAVRSQREYHKKVVSGYSSLSPSHVNEKRIHKTLKDGMLSTAVSQIQQLPETIAGNVPGHLASSLLTSAIRLQKSSDALFVLRPLKGKIAAGPLEAIIKDSARNKNVLACRRLHMISSELLVPKTNEAFESLAFAYSDDAFALRALIEEADIPLALPLAEAVLKACATAKHVSLISEVLQRASTKDVAYLRSLVGDDRLQRNSPSTSAGSSDAASSVGNSPRASSSDEVTSLSALSIPPSEHDDSPAIDISLCSMDIRSCGKAGDLQGAIDIFESIGSQAHNSMIFNSMVEACFDCGDFEKGMLYFSRAKGQNIADDALFNTMTKGCVAHGREEQAAELLKQLIDMGSTPMRSSYHALLNSRVKANDFHKAWKIVTEMQVNGICPTPVTCTILLKAKFSSATEVSRILALIDAMQEPMDEMLFTALVETCVRTQRLDALSRQLQKFMRMGGAASLQPPAYGSMIKAYGKAKDLKHVRDLWSQMMKHQILPTSVTLGCMVEALVANGCSKEAWKLVQKIWNDESTRLIVNTVTYSSLLKGFANSEDTGKVMAVYEEMRSKDIQPNTITFNTILNAFAKGGAMHRVPALLDDMKAANPPIEPDIVTYSTIVKGYCHAGSLDRALAVVEDMTAGGKYAPDEVMFNSLLSGCAKEHRPDEAMQLLKDMRKFGVAPSNYTLSVLVKLMGRCRRIDQAFAILEDISKEHDLKINIQVYTCLIQGCFNNGLTLKALGLHDRIIQEGLVPDSMTYTVLVRGCLQAGALDKAFHLAKCAYGVDSASAGSKESSPGLNAGCLDDLIARMGGTENEDVKKLLADLANCHPAVSWTSYHPVQRGFNY